MIKTKLAWVTVRGERIKAMVPDIPRPPRKPKSLGNRAVNGRKVNPSLDNLHRLIMRIVKTGDDGVLIKTTKLFELIHHGNSKRKWAADHPALGCLLARLSRSKHRAHYRRAKPGHWWICNTSWRASRRLLE